MRKNFVLISLVISFMIMITAIVQTNKIRYSLPDTIQYSALTKPVQKQVECLAENIYFEAAHEPKEGQVAVALVTLNRLSSGNYKSDVCGVVNQKTDGTCQFSWVCMPTFADKRLTIKGTSLYNDIRKTAMHVLLNYGEITDVTKGATYYHADYVNPNWKLLKTTQIGRHIFYKSSKDTKMMEAKL